MNHVIVFLFATSRLLKSNVASVAPINLYTMNITQNPENESLGKKNAEKNPPRKGVTMTERVVEITAVRHAN